MCQTTDSSRACGTSCSKSCQSSNVISIAASRQGSRAMRNEKMRNGCPELFVNVDESLRWQWHFGYGKKKDKCEPNTLKTTKLFLCAVDERRRIGGESDGHAISKLLSTTRAEHWSTRLDAVSDPFVKAIDREGGSGGERWTRAR
ncbi:unnamed protein product [Soboliphyme baturini]|uniref:Uncharacterized protein n=1 Tax=Soboliphyme baturini TaxID=241478 RepID=A0A183J425_9BILA|nr:unnamed protein product [Soboliphyme baturini]